MRYLTNIAFIGLSATEVGLLAAGSSHLSTTDQIVWVSCAGWWAGLEWLWKARAR